MYGNTTNSDGKSLENSIVPILTGLHVSGNKIKGIAIFQKEDGEKDLRRAILTIEQANGAELRHTVWDGLKQGEPDEKSMDRLNGFMLHLALGTQAASSPEEYSSLIGSPGSFSEFIETFNNKIISKILNKTFTFTIIKRENTSNGKWYAQLPIFPNFVEVDGTKPTTLYMKKDYVFEAPEVTKTDDLESSSAANADDLF